MAYENIVFLRIFHIDWHKSESVPLPFGILSILFAKLFHAYIHFLYMVSGVYNIYIQYTLRYEQIETASVHFEKERESSVTIPKHKNM